MKTIFLDEKLNKTKIATKKIGYTGMKLESDSVIGRWIQVLSSQTLDSIQHLNLMKTNEN